MSVYRSLPESMGISRGKAGAYVHIHGTVGHYPRCTRTYVAKAGATQLITYIEPNHRETNVTQLRTHLAEGAMKNTVRGGDENGVPNARKAIECRLPNADGKCIHGARGQGRT